MAIACSVAVQAWLDDVVAHCENKITVDFPIIADPTRAIAVSYGMIDPELKDAEGLPLTCRSVFIVGPDKKLKLSLKYVGMTRAHVPCLNSLT